MFTPEKIKEIKDSVGDDGYSTVPGYLVLECLDEIQRLREALMFYAYNWDDKSVGQINSKVARKALGEKT